MNMEKRIVLECRGRDPSQVKELNLDNCRSTSILGLTDEYKNLQVLSLNSVGLTSLKGFPTLPELRKLELSDNRISNGLGFLTGCKKLAHLNLSGNKIRDLEALKPLEEFKNLKNLDLFNNDVTTVEDYKTKVFAMHPSLIYLDGFDKYDREADESEIEEVEDEMNGNNDSDEDDSGEEEEDDDVSLRAVYNAEEESSSSSIFEGSDVEEEEDDEDDDDDVENNTEGQQHNTKAQDGDADGVPEESTRGKKRKHEDDDEN